MIPPIKKRSNRLRTVTDILANRLRREFMQRLKECNIRFKINIFKTLGYTKEAFANYLMAKYVGRPCVRCKLITITLDNSQFDHIKPISSAKNLAEIIVCNRLSNCRLICASCNRQKSNKIED